MTAPQSDQNDFNKLFPECAELFQKIYHFNKKSDWTLPHNVFVSDKFTIDHLQDMKTKLNEVKSKLSEFNLNEWSLHTKRRDASSYIMDFLKKKIKPELVTQAWCKFYEILSNFPIMLHDRVFKTLHLCEAPGGFVCALNHYLQLNYPFVEWYWVASTLNPDYEGNSLSEMIPDDRLIRYTRNNWYFGADLTGDIQKYYNHLGVVSQGDVSFVTADGSVDCMKDPGEQERHVEFLHYSETMTALAVLQKGGSYIFKVFTMFEDTTICLMYLMNCLFDKVNVIKPCSSKSGNSEVYVVCEVFGGFDLVSPIWTNLSRPYVVGGFNENFSMFSLCDLPKTFLTQIYECCEYFMVRQIATITKNIDSFKNMCPLELENIELIKNVVAHRYVEKCELIPIRREQKIIPYAQIHGKWRKNTEHFMEQFNFIYSSDLKLKNQHNALSIKFGKRIEKVYSSKFTTYDNLDKIMKSFSTKKESPFLYNHILNNFDENIIVTNVNEFDLSVYYKYQKQLFSRLICCIDNIHDYSSMLFINVPFYTHFLAGLFYLLACNFTSIVFHSGFVWFLNPVLYEIRFLKETLHQIEEQFELIDHSKFPTDVIQIVKPECFNNKIVEILHYYHLVT